ncbi:MAG: GTPase HflX, partial [Dermatophilaceae bacterium]|nr:GTPase HflX [Dermatophilaceae bacterium]
MTRRTDLLAGKATSLADDDLDPHGWGSAAYPGGPGTDFDGDQLDREERAALRRVAGLSTELEDVTEVEYRQLRLERVVLAAVWTEGTVQDAENSIRELAALAETAGSTVLDG